MRLLNWSFGALGAIALVIGIALLASVSASAVRASPPHNVPAAHTAASMTPATSIASPGAGVREQPTSPPQEPGPPINRAVGEPLSLPALERVNVAEPAATEFLPPLWGFRIKFTDALLVFFTGLLAYFTYALNRSTKLLWRAGERQLHLVERQVESSREEFVSTHRPRVIVRRFSLDHGSIQNNLIGQTWKIQFIVANVGATAATIIESNATLVRYEGELPAIPPFSAENQLAPDMKLAPGASAPLSLYLDADQVNIIRLTEMSEQTRPRPDNGGIYCFGYLQYRDDVGVVRRTAFCRKYDPSAQRMNPVDDSEYEYAD